MQRFIFLFDDNTDESLIREDQIVKVQTNNRMKHAVLANGEDREISSIEYDCIIGRNHVVQLLPAKKNTYGRYRDSHNPDAKWYSCKVDAWAVCADGSIRPVNYSDYFNALEQFLDEDCLFELDDDYVEEEVESHD